MNRLLRISFDTLLTSVTPIFGWLLLGILIDKNLINIFSLIYPMQFVIGTIQSVFGTGANISAVRDNNKNSTFSVLVLGSVIGLLILGTVVFNIDTYISFMNMDITIYRIFAIYAIIQMFLQLLLNLSLHKLYYENKTKKANKYSLAFNLINFLSLIIMSLITKNQIAIASFSIIATTIFICFMMFKTITITRIKINLLHCIKYDSVTLFAQISMFIIYLFGFKNSFDFGAKYILATSFSVLITDTQWDIIGAVRTVAQIDIAKRVFSYKEHMINSRILSIILISSSLVMGTVLYPFYKVDVLATFVIAGIELLFIYMYPIYITKLTFIQLEHSAFEATSHKQIANALRILCSFIPSPFCTSIGLIISATYQLGITEFIICKNNIDMELQEKNTFNQNSKKVLEIT